MKLKEFLKRCPIDGENIQIFQPPYMGGPRTPPPIVIRSIKGTDGLIVETEGKIIEKFSGNENEVKLQKEKFLKDRCLIFD